MATIFVHFTAITVMIVSTYKYYPDDEEDMLMNDYEEAVTSLS